MGEIRMRSKWCALAIWVVAACGGDDSSNGVVTGLPAEQKLSTLSDADLKKACQSVNNGAMAVITPTALKQATCVTVAVPSAVTYTNDQVSVDIDKCQQAVDTCLSASGQGDTEDGINDCDEATASNVRNCDATVGEYETCINMVLSAVQRKLGELTCQNAEKLSSEEYNNDDLNPENIPECQSLMTKCPDAELGIPYAD